MTDQIRKEFEQWRDDKPNQRYGEPAWDAWQAALASRQDEIDALIETMQEVLRISDRKHDAWDRAKEVIAKMENLK